MKKLPIGLQNFKEIITENYLYFDKTPQIYRLIQNGKLFFLSRPRRFGKSLLLSTLEYIFRGEKELFKDLYIGQQTDWEWKSYPILYFNFASYGKTYPEQLEKSMKIDFQQLAETHNVDLPDWSIPEQFKYLVKKIVEKNPKIVILVDEYDKPIIDFLQDFPTAAKNRRILKNFFSTLKELERSGFIRFLFITGISKFSKVSIFSDLNNLTDLTLSTLAVDLVGITKEEIEENASEHIQVIAKKMNITPTELLKETKFWYNGYSWDAKTFVYNPFSLLSFFVNQKFANYWFSSGTPTFLVNSIRNKQINIQELEGKTVGLSFFDKFDIENLDMFSLLFQTGYLTIKSSEIKRRRELFTLGYPNYEVKEAFIYNLVEAFSYKTPTTVNVALLKIEDSLFENELEIFIEQIKILFADIAYQMHPKKKKNATAEEQAENFAMWEGYFHSIIYLIISFLGIYIECEVSRHKGRLDAMINTENYLYLIEFKVGSGSKTAIEQIKEREYAASYKNTEKKIILLGVAFDKETRNVKDWKSEEWKRN